MKRFARDVETPFPHQRRDTGSGIAEENVAHIFAIQFVTGWNLDTRKFADARQPIDAGNY